MKKLTIVLAAMALIAGFGMMQAEAAPTDTIAVTVTLQNISVSVTPDTWPLGIKAPGSITIQACTATNDGNVNENLDIAASNGTTWSASTDGSAGIDEFLMRVQAPPSLSWSIIAPLPFLPVSFATALAPTAAKGFDLEFTAPSVGSNVTPQAITVTVTAAAA